jgi:hypothetical protein
VQAGLALYWWQRLITLILAEVNKFDKTFIVACHGGMVIKIEMIIK